MEVFNQLNNMSKVISSKLTQITIHNGITLSRLQVKGSLQRDLKNMIEKGLLESQGETNQLIYIIKE